MIVALAIATVVLVVWNVRREFFDRPVDDEGGLLELPLADGWEINDVLVTLAEISSLPEVAA